MKTEDVSVPKRQLFFAANALTSVGMNIGVVGVAWFIIRSTGQNSVLGLYNAISLAAAFAALSACGALIDHKSKTVIMKYCAMGQGLLFAVTAVLCKSGVPVLFIIYMLAVLNMPGMVIFTTASRGAVPAVLPAERMAQGNGIIEVTLQLGAICAALLTAFFYQRLGFAALMWAGALATWAGGFLFWRAKNAFDCPAPASAGWRRNLLDGVDYLWRDKKLFICGLVVFLPTIVISVSNVIIPGYVQFTLQGGAMTYGVADMIFALGALGAGIYAGRLGAVRRGNRLMNILFILSVAGMLFFALNHAMVGFFVCVCLTGLVLAGLRVLLNTFFMQIVPGNYLGRALAVLMAVSVVLQAALSYVTGQVMDRFGPPAGFVLAGGLLLLGLGTWLYLRRTANRN